MSCPSKVRCILQYEGLEEPILLGAGEDAYALSYTEAVRIFPHASRDFVSELRGSRRRCPIFARPYRGSKC